jgi:hypothetical protein
MKRKSHGASLTWLLHKYQETTLVLTDTLYFREFDCEHIRNNLRVGGLSSQKKKSLYIMKIESDRYNFT